MFPFPKLNEAGSHLDSTDISEIEVGILLETEWKAKNAVRDDTLVQKLCDILQGRGHSFTSGYRNLLTTFSLFHLKSMTFGPSRDVPIMMYVFGVHSRLFRLSLQPSIIVILHPRVANSDDLKY